MRDASLPLPHDAIYFPTEMRFSTAVTPAAAHVACSATRRSAAERTSPDRGVQGHQVGDAPHTRKESDGLFRGIPLIWLFHFSFECDPAFVDERP
jgi:hypothetical protein